VRAPLIVPIATRALRTFALAAAFGSSTSLAFAQDTAAAAALFEKGLDEMKAGNYETGCPSLEESYRLDPLPGVLFTSAECHAQWGKYATAVARYEDYLRAFQGMRAAQQERQHGRDEISKQKLSELRPLVPQLTLVLPASAPDGTIVKRGSLKLGKPSLGVPIPVDPGEHLITTEVPGGAVHEQRVSIEKSEKKTVELEIELPAQTSSGTAPPPTTTTQSATLDTRSVASGSSGRTLAYIVGGIGLVGLATGGVTGGLALSKKKTIDDHCVETRCDHEGKQAADSAKTFALISTIGFAVGAAGLAASAVLLITAPSSSEKGVARIGPKSGSRTSGSAKHPRADTTPGALEARVSMIGKDGAYISLSSAW